MDILKELKQKSLVEFFQNYLNIELQKTGKNYFCPCPIHEDVSPSFYIDPVKNRWSCFGTCNYSGDIIDFAIRYKSLTFPEGIEWVAKKYGIQYKLVQGIKKEDFSEYYNICSFVSDFYKYSEVSYNKIGREYLIARRISLDIIQNFVLGIASSPSEIGTWTFLTNELRKQNFDLNVCEKIGVIRKTDKGTFYDAFLGRIIIPIFDLKDRCIGFNTRTYTTTDDGTPKYLLSKETPIFKKLNFTYGLNKSLKYIKQQNMCYFVEGCFDYFRMYEYGYKNVVPLLGGKILNDVIDVDNYGFIMDPDKAGIKYSLENGANLICKGKNVLIVECDKDPDDCTKEDLQVYINNYLSYLDFYLKHTYKYPTSIEHKLKIVDNLIKLLKNINKDQLYLYVRDLSHTLDIPAGYVLHRFGLENKTFEKMFTDIMREM